MLSLVGGAAQFLSGYGQNYSTGSGTVITTTDPVTGAVTQTRAGLLLFRSPATTT